MGKSFFEKELDFIRERFNQTFGRQTVCNLQTRYRVILSIVGLGILCDKINRADSPDLVRDEIKRFCNTRNKLMTLFTQTEQIWTERRGHEETTKRSAHPRSR
jgi:hypothetical protein